MWHIFKADLSDRKYFFIFGNLFLGLAIFALYTSYDHPVIVRILKAMKIIGVLGIASLTISFPAKRAQDKRDRQHSQLPITTQRVGIARLGTSAFFWVCLLFWIQTGVYLTQNLTSYPLFMIETGRIFALAITLSATIHIIHDYMYNIFTDPPGVDRNPIVMLLVALSYGALTIIFMESAFGAFGWDLISLKTTFSGSIFFLFLFLCLSIATTYISSLLFTKRHSYLA